MTTPTLREVRDVIHGLEQQRLEFARRKANGERCCAFTSNSLAIALSGRPGTGCSSCRIAMPPFWQRATSWMSARFTTPWST